MAEILYIDGGCEGNSQPDMHKRRMVAVVTRADGSVVSEQRAEGGSNNIAELLAVRDALLWCQDSGIHDVQVFTDSKNNLAWVDGSKVGKSINDRVRVLALRSQIAFLRTDIHLALTWIPRASNKAGHYIEQEYAL